MMQTRCSSCGGEVPGEHVNAEWQVAKCEACNRVFDLREPGRRDRSRRLPAAPAYLRIVAGDVDIDGDGDAVSYRTTAPSDLVIDLRWFRWEHVSMVLWSALWCVPWMRTPSSAGELVWPLDILRLLARVLLCLPPIYATACVFVNRTRIALKCGALVVRHVPLWWPFRALGIGASVGWRGVLRVEVSLVEQLFCQAVVDRNGKRTFALQAVLRDGARVPLLTGFVEPDPVHYLELVLERRLGIEDAPVEGEWV